jgi:hypothetical protein
MRSTTLGHVGEAGSSLFVSVTELTARRVEQTELRFRIRHCNTGDDCNGKYRSERLSRDPLPTRDFWRLLEEKYRFWRGLVESQCGRHPRSSFLKLIEDLS